MADIFHGKTIIVPDSLIKYGSIEHNFENNYHIGFFGCSGQGSSLHGKLIEKYFENIIPYFFILTGDNFCDFGLNNDNSYLLGEKCFLIPYIKNTQKFKNTTFFPVLGSCDYGSIFNSKMSHHRTEPECQLYLSEILSCKNWNMPGFYYHIKNNNNLFEFFCIDSNTILYDEIQQNWLIEKISISQAQWKILVSHHPIISYGQYSNENNINRFNSFFIKNNLHKKINLLISAYEHNNQLIHYLENCFQIIVGNCSSKTPYKVNEKENLIYCSYNINDFSCGCLKISENDININIYTQTQNKEIEDINSFSYKKELVKIKWKKNLFHLPIIKHDETNLSYFEGEVMLNYFSFLNELSFDEKNFTNWSCIFSQVYLLNEVSKKIYKLKRNWEKNSFQIFGTRNEDFKSIDFSLKNSFVYVKIIDEAIFKEKINWKFTKFLAEEIFYLFSDIHFFCLKNLYSKYSKSLKVQKAIEELKKDVIEVYNLIFKIFVCYYYNKSTKDSRFNNFYERALEKIYMFEVLSNRTRNLKGFKFITKIKFYYTIPQKN